MKTLLKTSKLPIGQTLENFDFAFQPAIERSRIDTLGSTGCSIWHARSGCVHHGDPATDFHEHPATHSTAIRPPVPRASGHPSSRRGACGAI